MLIEWCCQIETLVSFVIQILKEIFVYYKSIKQRALALQTQDGADNFSVLFNLEINDRSMWLVNDTYINKWN